MELDLISVFTAKKNQFAKRGIFTVEDLLFYMPKRFNDYSRITGLLSDGSTCCVKATVTDVFTRNAGKAPFICAICQEELTRQVFQVFWFHSQWNYQNISAQKGKTVYIIGKAAYNGKYQQYTITQPEAFSSVDCLGIYPVYKSVPGMSTDYLTEKIGLAMMHGAADSEMLPEDILARTSETPMPLALQYIHQPETMAEAEIGKNRVLLNDLVYFALHNELNKSNAASDSQFRITSLKYTEAIQVKLPFTLTDDQQSALAEMIETGKSGKRIHALLQGDVGCGKTIVAALLIAAFVSSGYQAVMMAPTQVLAKQHLKTFKDLFDPLGVDVTYLDSSLSGKEKRAAQTRIANGEAQIVIGTHACISSAVEYHNLGLAIVDEEHKFGVKQRASIVAKAEQGVHSVTMSATPIPRSLAQVIYGENIQLHTIKTMPQGRKPVITGISTDKRKVFKFIASEVRKGHQVYVVCPMIDPSEKSPDVQSVEEVADEYTGILYPLGVRIATLTGRDSKAATDDVLERFNAGLIDVLIATTVIEVGVNVPSATVMIITNAERFGLAGLHQLRGRVGRGEDQSYCVLQTNSTDEKVRQRLDVLCNSTDGFCISKSDLKLRGAGDLLGTQQSGENKYVQLMLAYPERHKQATEIAKEIISRGMDCCKLAAKVQAEREAMTNE